MNLGWNHILLACLLTVLEIYGTEAILSIPYTRLIDVGNRAICSTVMPRALVKCGGGSHVLLQLDSSETSGISFKNEEQWPPNAKVLFYAVRGNSKEIVCSYYTSRGLYDVRSNSLNTLTIEKQGAGVQFIFQMNEVYEVMNGIKSDKPAVSFKDGPHYVLHLHHLVGFSMDYKVGTFPTRLRTWNFKPSSNCDTQSVKFYCGPSTPVVEFHCTDYRCAGIEYCTDVENPKNVMAYIVIDRNEKVRVVKGNKKKVPKHTLCTLYARNNDEVQFPLFGKNHINVADDYDNSSKLRMGRGDHWTGKGFRIYTKSLKIVWC